MPFIFAIVLVIFGAFAWQKCGDDVANMCQSGTNICKTIKKESVSFKNKIENSIEKNTKNDTVVSTNHRK